MASDSHATIPPTGHGAVAFALWRAAVIPGLLLAAVAVPAVIASGRLPEGVGLWVAAGAVVASITSALGIFVKCRAVAAPPDPRGLNSGLQIAIMGDFVLNLFGIGVTLLVLFFLVGLKFDLLAGFALAFASVALGHQLLSAMVLSRALKRRARNGIGSDGAPTASSATTAPSGVSPPTGGSGPAPGASAPSPAESGS